jgi:hypothetical protein
MAAKANSATLKAMWETMVSFTLASSIDEISKITTYFEPDTTAYINGITAPPAKSHQELIETVQNLVRFWKMQQLNVTNEIVSADGKKIVRTMINHIMIAGQDIEGFNECEVVLFSENGLIKEYLLYLDPTDVMAVFAKAGEGKP